MSDGLKMTLRDKTAVALLGLLASLPLLETILHYAIINRSAVSFKEAVSTLPSGFIPTTILVAVSGWLLMVLAFVANGADLRGPLEYARRRIDDVRRRITGSIATLLL